MPSTIESARELIRSIDFPVDEVMTPMLLKKFNPDYGRFQKSSLDANIANKQYLSVESHGHIAFIANFGPSAVGKDAILDNLDKTKVPFTRIITTTTREDRTTPNSTDKYVFISKNEFSYRVRKGDFIEHVSQIAGQYGTTIEQATQAIEGKNRIIVWRGEETGLPKMWAWLTKNYPGVQRHVLFILPQMSFFDLAVRIVQMRGELEAKGRIEKAYKEIVHAGSIADFLILNPPQSGGPIDATRATQKLFTFLSTHRVQTVR